MAVVVVGGSIAGLSAALFLARSGREVVLLEADDTPAPDAMPPELQWFRRGTPHGAQAHTFTSGFVRELRRRAPDVLDALLDGGAILRTAQDIMPATIEDRTPMPGDEELVVVNARRPFVEWTLRRFALAEPRVTWRPGTHVTGVDARVRTGIPHVTGVILESGERIPAEAVIDATGRRSRIDEWLRSSGSTPSIVVEEPCNQLYFTRYYVLRDDATPPKPNNGFVVAAPLPFGAVLIFPGDNGVIQCAVGCLPDDDAMKRVRDPGVFDALASALPATEPWISQATPLGEVAVMAGLRNMVRRLVRDGVPLVTGLHAIGDARLTTNPQYGRGVSHAAIDAVCLVEALADDDPIEQSLRMDREVTRLLEPSFRDSAMLDRARTAVWRGGLTGAPPTFDTLEIAEAAALQQRSFAATARDPVIWRASGRGTMLLEVPGAWRAQPELRARLEAVELPVEGSAPALPTRARVLELLA